MVTPTEAAAGVGGASVGIVASETLIHVADEQATVVTGVAGFGAIGLATAGALGVGPIPDAAVPGLAGFGMGSLVWLAGRRQGVLPALAVDVPGEVNVVEPVITALAIGTVLLAADTVSNVVLS